MTHKKIGFISPVYFIVFVLIMMFMKANPFINNMRITDIFMAISVVTGGIYSVFIIYINRKSVFKNKYFIILGLFTAIYIITVIINRQYSFAENVKDIIWFAIQVIAIFLALYYAKSIDSHQIFLIVSCLYVCVTFIFAAGSIVFVFLNKGGVVEFGKWGFISQRLFGLYRSPNYGAVYCALSVMVSVGLLLFFGVSVRVFLCINLAVNVLYIIYSGSNTGKVVLMAGLVVYCVLLLVGSGDFKSLIKRTLVSALTIFIVFYSFPIVKNVTSKIISSENNNSQGQTEEDTGDNDVTFDRDDYVEGSELGNGRLLHWQGAMKVFPKYALFGTSVRGYNEIINKDFPELDKIYKAYSLENDIVTLFICCGIIGALIFIIFVIMGFSDGITVIRKVIKTHDKQKYIMYSMCFAVLVVIAISSLFTDAIVFTNVLQSTAFWIYFGCLLNYKNVSEEKH